MKEDAKQRRSYVDKAGKLSVVRQCELLDIHRSGVYYETVGETALNLELMRLIDEKNLLHPRLGVRASLNGSKRTWGTLSTKSASRGCSA